VTIKKKRLLIMTIYYGTVTVVCLAGIGLGEACAFQDLSLFAILVLIGHVLTFRLNPLPQVFQERHIQQAECPACGETFDLINTWTCSCGYVTWRPRHAFSPCPHCKKIFRWLVCPQCDASVVI